MSPASELRAAMAFGELHVADVQSPRWPSGPPQPGDHTRDPGGSLLLAAVDPPASAAGLSPPKLSSSLQVADAEVVPSLVTPALDASVEVR